MTTLFVKAVGDWVLEVLGVPFGGPFNGKDADGEYFSSRSNLHADKYPAIPAVYYHGLDADGRPKGKPEYIGKAEFVEIRTDGAWYQVVLDKANEYAKRVWEAAKKKTARASSGSIPQLVRIAADGHIDEWPVAEMTLLDAEKWRQPVNNYAVVVPMMKSIYEKAGIVMPDFGEPEAEGGAGSMELDPAKAANQDGNDDPSAISTLQIKARAYLLTDGE